MKSTLLKQGIKPPRLNFRMRKRCSQRTKKWNILSLITLQLAIALTLRPVSGQFNPTKSVISPYTDILSDVPTTVTVTAYDDSNNRITTGGEIIYLLVQQECTKDPSSYTCVPAVPSDNVGGLPQFPQMADNGDGTYTADWVVSATQGTVTISAVHYTDTGFIGDFWTNTSWSGTPASTGFRGYEDLCGNLNLGDPTRVGGTGASSSVSGHWTGYLKVPETGSYQITCQGDDQCYELILDGQSKGNQFSGSHYFNAGFVTFSVKWYQGGGGQWISFTWQKPSAQNHECISGANDVVHNPNYIGNAVHSLEVVRSTIPAKSTFDQIPTATLMAGTTFTIQVQGRDMASQPTFMASDAYAVTLDITPSNAGASSSSESLTVTHMSNGRHDVDKEFTIAGSYVLSASISNDYTATDSAISNSITNSPQSFTVLPGPADAGKSYFIPVVPLPAEFPNQIAGLRYEILIQFIDAFDNLHIDTTQRASNTIEILAEYENHDAWGSPIEVEDLVGWEATYGVDFPGTQTDNGDGTMNSQFEIFRAGAYKLSVKIDGNDIKDTPVNFLQVQASDLFPPNCIVQDFPESMIAGYEYFFLIQGRDEFHNNVHCTVGEAVGNDYSANYYLQSDSSEYFSGTLENTEYPGVYQVLAIPSKTQASGDYDLRVLFGGQQVPTPVVTIEPCTNVPAAELAWIAEAGRSITLSSLDYTIRQDGSETISLPLVPLYCEHEFTQVLISATATFSNREEVLELDLDQLSAYGIKLQPTGQNPHLEVYTEDLSFADITFEIVLNATVIEETTWADTSSVKITYFAPEFKEFNTEAFAVEDPPMFSLDIGDSNQFVMAEDEEGVQYLKPVYLDCDQEWTKILPPIEGESTGVKVTVTIDLGEAAAYLTYSPKDRAFKHEKSLSKQETNKILIIGIDLANQNGRSSSYSLRVIYKCEVPDPSIPPNSFELKFDEDPPVAKIASVSSFGDIIVEFDRLMRPQAALSDKEFKPKRLLSDGQEVSVTGGIPSSAFSNFTLIHNSTVVINGTTYPSISLKVVAEDPESFCSKHLDFFWQVMRFTTSEIEFKLDFGKPECVSSSGQEGDTLVITFYDQRLFSDTEGKLIWTETKIERRLVKQMLAEGTQKDVLDAAASSTSTTIVAASILNVLTNLLLQASIGKLVNALKNLQIIVHIMLIQVNMVAHAEKFLHGLQELIAFEAIDISGVTTTTLDVFENEAMSIGFESMGYETSDAILNLGPIFAFMVLSPFLIAFFYLLSKCCCCAKVKSYAKGQVEKSLFNRVIFFVDGSFLIITVCCMINVYQVKRGVAEQNSSYYFSLGWFAISVSLVIGLIVFIGCKYSKLNREVYKKRIGAAYEDLDTRKSSKNTLLFMSLTFVRRMALSVILTYGRQSSLVAQLFFMNFSSVLLVIYVGIFRPLRTQWANKLELGNEYTILLLYVATITQTDFVERIDGRMFMGWVLIILLCLNILANFGNILVKDLQGLYRKIKIYWYKRKFLARRAAYLAKKAEELAQKNAEKLKTLPKKLPQSDDDQDLQLQSIRSHRKIQLKIKPKKKEEKVKALEKVEVILHRPQNPLSGAFRQKQLKNGGDGQLSLQPVYNFKTTPTIQNQKDSYDALQQMALIKNPVPYVNTDYITPEQAAKMFYLPTIKKPLGKKQ